MKFLSTIPAALVMTLALGATARAEEGETPDSVVLRGFAYAGTGCPADTVRGRFPVEGKEFLITWGGFEASAGPNIPLREARKNCQLNLDLAYPEGWQYTVESTSYQGTVEVAEGSQAIAASSFYFQGQTQTIRFGTLFEGPVTRTFHVTDAVQDRDQVWSSCTADRSLNVNYQVRIPSVTDGQARGKIAFGTDVDGEPVGTLLKLKWRRCG